MEFAGARCGVRHGRHGPAQRISLPFVVVPKAGGVAAVDFFVPALPSLAGISAYGQAVLVPDPLVGSGSLTNVTLDEVWQ